MTGTQANVQEGYFAASQRASFVGVLQLQCPSKLFLRHSDIPNAHVHSLQECRWIDDASDPIAFGVSHGNRPNMIHLPHVDTFVHSEPRIGTLFKVHLDARCTHELLGGSKLLICESNVKFT